MIAFSNFPYEDIVQYFEESLFDLDADEIDLNYEENKQKAIQKTILDLMNLKKISFDFFNNCDILNSALQLKNSSNYFPSLEYLSISFSNYSQTEQSVFENFGIFISNLKSLERLSLIVNGFQNQKVNYSFNIFSGIFKNIPKQLNTLKLDIQFIDLDQSSIEIFAKYLENLNNLKYLDIQIGKNSLLKAQNAAILANSIQKLTQLRGLHIIIESDNQISQEGIIKLLQNIKYLKALENLHLDIFGNEIISDQILKEAKFSFQNLENLIQFKWILKSKTQNKYFTDDLDQLLPSTKSLKQIDLIYEQQYDCLISRQLNKLDNLTILDIQINLFNTSIDTDSLLQNIFQINTLEQLYLNFEKHSYNQDILTLNLDCLYIQMFKVNEANQLVVTKILQSNDNES
ncbi:hypothetical protein ABPG74_017692 [Tetrahymena malaccensis]